MSSKSFFVTKRPVALSLVTSSIVIAVSVGGKVSPLADETLSDDVKVTELGFDLLKVKYSQPVDASHGERVHGLKCYLG